MNNGFVAMRRGVLDHLADGRMSTTEFHVFVCLVLDADAGTGRGTINAPKLNALWLQDMSNDSCKRVLASLEDKGYIFRDIPFKSKRAYSYWVHKYQCSKGKNEMLLTDISQARVSKQVKDIRYAESAPDITPDMTPEVPPEIAPDIAPDVPHSYDKDTEKDKDKNKNKTSTVVSVPNVCFQSVPTSSKKDACKERSPNTNPVCAQTVPPKRAYSVPSNPCAAREPEPELTVAQEEALAMQEIAKEIARRNKGAA